MLVIKAALGAGIVLNNVFISHWDCFNIPNVINHTEEKSICSPGQLKLV